MKNKTILISILLVGFIVWSQVQFTTGQETTSTTTTTIDTTTTTTSNSTSNATTTTSEKSGRITLDLVQFFGDLFSKWYFWMAVCLIILLLADFNNHPIVKIMGMDGKKMDLGRYLTEIAEPKVNKRKLIFLTDKGIKIVYSNYSFRSLDPFLFQRVYAIQWDYPHVHLVNLKLPPKVEMESETVSKGLWNGFLWIIFKIFCFTPFRFITTGIFGLMKKTKKKISEIPFLVPYLSMDSLEYRFNVNYEIEELDPNANAMAWIKKTQKDVIYSDILNIRKNKIQKMLVELAEVKCVRYETLKDALEDKKSRNEIVNSYENRLLELESTIMDLETRLRQSYEQIQNLKLATDEKIRTALRPMEESNEYLRKNFPDMLAEALQFRSLGFDEIDSIRKAIVGHLDHQDTTKQKLQSENAELRAKMMSRDIFPPKQFNPYDITINEEKLQPQQQKEATKSE